MNPRTDSLRRRSLDARPEISAERAVVITRFYRENDGRIRLQPANERMSPIYAAEGDVKVQGVVVGLMRKY